MIDNIIAKNDNVLNATQKVLGILVNEGFMIYESSNGNRIAASNNEHTQIMKKYLVNKRYPSLNQLILDCGGILTEGEGDIDITIGKNIINVLS